MPICVPARYQGIPWGSAVCVMCAIHPHKELTVVWPFPLQSFVWSFHLLNSVWPFLLLFFFLISPINSMLKFCLPSYHFPSQRKGIAWLSVLRISLLLSDRPVNVQVREKDKDVWETTGWVHRHLWEVRVVLRFMAICQSVIFKKSPLQVLLPWEKLQSHNFTGMCSV